MKSDNAITAEYGLRGENLLLNRKRRFRAINARLKVIMNIDGWLL
jgi:hypothetical protein